MELLGLVREARRQKQIALYGGIALACVGVIVGGLVSARDRRPIMALGAIEANATARASLRALAPRTYRTRTLPTAVRQRALTPTSAPTAPTADRFAVLAPRNGEVLAAPRILAVGVGTPGALVAHADPAGFDNLARVDAGGRWRLPVTLRPEVRELRFRQLGASGAERAVAILYIPPPEALAPAPPPPTLPPAFRTPVTLPTAPGFPTTSLPETVPVAPIATPTIPDVTPAPAVLPPTPTGTAPSIGPPEASPPLETAPPADTAVASDPVPTDGASTPAALPLTLYVDAPGGFSVVIMRDAATTESRIVRKIPDGEPVRASETSVTGPGGAQWYPVLYAGDRGYVRADLLAASPP